MKSFFSRFWNVGLPRLLFWGWNGLFLCVAGFGLLPELVPELMREGGRLGVPWSLVGALVGAFLIPPVVIVAALVRTPRPPQRLLTLLYGVEAPLFLLCLGRLFLLRELNPGVIFVALAFGVAALSSAFDLFAPEPAGDNFATERFAGLRLAGATVASLTGVYVAIFLSFYVVPAAAMMIKLVLRFDWLHMFVVPHFQLKDVMAFLAVVLVVCSVLLFLAAPFALPWIYGRLWCRWLGRRSQRLASVGGMVVLAALFALANRQPQRGVLERLATPPVNDAQKSALLADSAHVRSGLLNAYLGSYRYLGSIGENTHVRAMYREALGGKAERYRWLENCYNFLARPLLYDGSSLRADQARAEALYASFFDRPIQKAERSAIVHAVEASWERTEVAASLLEVEEKKVWLVGQDVSLREEPGWAELEIHEVYQNQTHQPLEVFYSLAMPETAVVTGLWLGDSNDRERRFAFTVAPRGAAQAVYRAEAQRRVDPALVEQVGPRQVRVRAFPVPAKPLGLGQPTPPLHLWLTVRVPEVDGRWLLPRLVERRNVFWDAASHRSWPGRPAAGDGWLPASLPVTEPRPAGAGFEATIAGYRVTASPLESAVPAPLPARVAVVIDGSRSMAALGGEVEAALDRLEERGLGVSEIDLVPATGAILRLGRRAELGETVFFGALRSADLLDRLTPLRFDASAWVLVLTDEGGYELPGGGAEKPALSAPTWLVHLGGRWPAAYDDGVIAALEASGGGVAGSIDEVLDTLAYRRRAPMVEEPGDGFLWRFERAAGAAQQSAAPAGFEHAAARRLIGVLGREGSLEALDAAHAIAREQGVVSSWSSMLVLVEDRQREALAKAEAEAEADRLERETETGAAKLEPAFSPFAVSGVPEPETWLLLVLAGAGLAWLTRRR